MLIRHPRSCGLTCAAFTFHGPHEVVGPLLAVQRLQQIKNIIIKHEMDQVEGPCRHTETTHSCYFYQKLQKEGFNQRLNEMVQCGGRHKTHL